MELLVSLVVIGYIAGGFKTLQIAKSVEPETFDNFPSNAVTVLLWPPPLLVFGTMALYKKRQERKAKLASEVKEIPQDVPPEDLLAIKKDPNASV